MRTKRAAHDGKALKRFANAPQVKNKTKITPFNTKGLYPDSFLKNRNDRDSPCLEVGHAI
jgi:hypothetical protein